MKKFFPFLLFLFVFLFVFLLRPPFVLAEEILTPWQVEKAESRQLFVLESAATREKPTVTIPLAGDITVDGKTLRHLRLVDPTRPNLAIPCEFQSGSCRFIYPGKISADKPGYLYAYYGKELTGQPLVTTPLPTVDDYATKELKTPWDFRISNASVITSWGDRPHQYGKIEIKDGRLVIPIIGNDVYFIFGIMWGNPEDPRQLKIDSALYRYLEMEISQSVPNSKWLVYVTNKGGEMRATNITVTGTEEQTVRIDLAEAFPDFWGKGTFRALRIDPLDRIPKTEATVRAIRLLSSPVNVTACPLFTREEIAIRDSIVKVETTGSDSVVAGRSFPIHFRVTMKAGTTSAGKSFKATFQTSIKKGDANKFVPAGDKGISSDEVTAFIHRELLTVKLNAKHQGTFSFTSREQAGKCDIQFGPADDCGNIFLPVVSSVNIQPNPVVRYELVPEYPWFDATRPSQRVFVYGVDQYGNTSPVNILKPAIKVNGGFQLSVAPSELKGNPASFELQTNKPEKRKDISVTLSDHSGRTGQTSFCPIYYRKERIKLDANGFTVRENGSPYLPVGGLYGNWPHKTVPNSKGLPRSLDLFPCSNNAYLCGFPWKKEVEANVRNYFDHCRKHGINTIRLMLRNMDLVGKVDRVQLDAVCHYMDLGHEYGIKFNVVLLEDYTKPPYNNMEILENIVLPHYSEQELKSLPPHRARFLVKKDLLTSIIGRYLDADAVACQRDYLRELIPVLAEHEAVFCYEFENEMHEYPGVWCAKTAAFIRAIDPHTLILGNPDHMARYRGLQWRDSTCDLVAYHTYCKGSSTADMGTWFVLKANWIRLAGIPFLTGEGGVYDLAAANPETRQAKEVQGIRDHIWGNFCSGGIGFMYWTLLNEPIADEIDKIAKGFQTVGIELNQLRRKKPEVAIVVPAEINSAMGEGNIDLYAARLVQKMLEAGLDFDCVPKGEEKDYRYKIELSENAEIPPGLLSPVARPSAGWNCVTLLDKNDHGAIIYLRNNVGGIKNFSVSDGQGWYFRDVQPDTPTLTLTDSQRWKKIVAYNLETGESELVLPNAKGELLLKKTAGDYLIGFINDYSLHSVLFNGNLQKFH